jgi:hypothetical protein
MMIDKSNHPLDKSLVDTLRVEDLNDLLKDISEIAIDSVLDDGLLKEIPLVSAVVALSKTSIAIRDRIFIKKILRFLNEISEISMNERNKFASQLESNPSLREKVGDAIIIFTERYDDLEKPELLAKVFKGYIKEKIDLDTFLRLSSSIDKTTISDLKTIFGYLSGEELDRKLERKLWERVYPTGLSEMIINIQVETNVNLLSAPSGVGFGDLIIFRPSDYARILNSLVHE